MPSLPVNTVKAVIRRNATSRARRETQQTATLIGSAARIKARPIRCFASISNLQRFQFLHQIFESGAFGVGPVIGVAFLQKPVRRAAGDQRDEKTAERGRKLDHARRTVQLRESREPKAE